MSDIPHDPSEFFRDYVPAQFAGVRASLAGRSSAGSMTFRALGAGGGEWSYRIENGELKLGSGTESDAIVQVTFSVDDFRAVLARGASVLKQSAASPDKHLIALKALTIDAERAKLISAVQGSAAFVVKDAANEHRVVVTPGSSAPNLSAPECVVAIDIADFWALQAGTANPFELLMNGKIRITGNAQIPMALAGLFT